MLIFVEDAVVALYDSTTMVPEELLASHYSLVPSLYSLLASPYSLVASLDSLVASSLNLGERDPKGGRYVAVGFT